ncbi:MAG: histidine kinase, partial [Actinomycetota bacterium]|nr:histidine kinase [Actinomycetota bacterium]
MRVHPDRGTSRPGPAEMAVAVAAAAVMVVGTLLDPKPGGQPLTAFGAFLLVAEAAPLVWRRRAPVLVLVATGVAAAAYGIAPYPDPLLHLGTLIALYTVIVACERRVAYLAGGVTAMAIVVSTAASGDSTALDYFSSLALAGVTWALAEGQRAREAYQAEVEARAHRLEAERDGEARRAVAEERVRIARELHDVVAHHVSMMVVQAEAGASVSATAPEHSAERFDGISATGRQALTELRRLVGVLRAEDEPRPAGPQPGLGEAESLVAQVREAGLTVSFRVEGRPRPLPAGVDLSAYRILQEALTNTVKHAGPAAASVVVRYRDDAIDLEVLDDGRGG